MDKNQPFPFLLGTDAFERYKAAMMDEPEPDKEWIRQLTIDKHIEKGTILLFAGNETTPLVANGDGTVSELAPSDDLNVITTQRIQKMLLTLEQASVRKFDQHQMFPAKNTYADLPKLEDHYVPVDHELPGSTNYSARRHTKHRNGSTKKYVKRKKARNGRR